MAHKKGKHIEDNEELSREKTRDMQSFGRDRLFPRERNWLTLCLFLGVVTQKWQQLKNWSNRWEFITVRGYHYNHHVTLVLYKQEETPISKFHKWPRRGWRNSPEAEYSRSLLIVRHVISPLWPSKCSYEHSHGDNSEMTINGRRRTQRKTNSLENFTFPFCTSFSFGKFVKSWEKRVRFLFLHGEESLLGRQLKKDRGKKDASENNGEVHIFWYNSVE